MYLVLLVIIKHNVGITEFSFEMSEYDQEYPSQWFNNFSTFLQVSTLARLSPDPHCHTQCGDGGCHCVANLLPLSQMDHLLLITDSGQAVSCLCGDFQVSKYVMHVVTSCYFSMRGKKCISYMQSTYRYIYIFIYLNWLYVFT